MVIVGFALLLFIVLPLLAVRHGADSRPGFGSPPDWRPLNR